MYIHISVTHNIFNRYCSFNKDIYQYDRGMSMQLYEHPMPTNLRHRVIRMMQNGQTFVRSSWEMLQRFLATSLRYPKSVKTNFILSMVE